MDHFEQQLQRQRLRQAPAAWREEILAAAQASSPGLRTRSEEPAGWSWLFARFPVAWGALAMLWATIISVNLLLSPPGSRTVPHPVFAAGVESLAAWRLRAAELSLLNGGSEDTTEHPPATPLRPRNERRRDGGGGASLAEPPNDFLA